MTDSKLQLHSNRLDKIITRIPDLSRAERAVLKYYKNLYIAYGRLKAVYPSSETVAKRTNYSDKTVRRAKNHLELCGFLKSVGNEKGGVGKSRLYFFMETVILDAGTGYTQGVAIRQYKQTLKMPKKRLSKSASKGGHTFSQNDQNPLVGHFLGKGGHFDRLCKPTGVGIASEDNSQSKATAPIQENDVWATERLSDMMKVISTEIAMSCLLANRVTRGRP